MIIADTSAILATIDPDSTEHKACVDLLSLLRRPMFVSPMVVAEVDYLLTMRFGVSTANRFLADVARGAWDLAQTYADDIDDVVTLNTRYQALKLGATDCLNVVMAANHGTTALFTLDHRHYRAITPLAGAHSFTLLPADRDQWLAARPELTR